MADPGFRLRTWLWNCIVKIAEPMVRVLPMGYDTDSATYQVPSVDADGHLQVDVLSGGGSVVVGTADHDCNRITAADITGSFQSLIANGGSSEIRVLEVWNMTDGTIQLSFDNGVSPGACIPPYGYISRDYRANDLKHTGSVQVREHPDDTITSNDGAVEASAVWEATP